MIPFFYRLLALVRKELLSILKDPSSRIILIMPVIMQSILFGYGATYDLVNVPYAVIDESRSVTSAEFLSHLDGTGYFHRVASVDSMTEASDLLDTQKVLMVIRIEPRLEAKLAAGESVALQLVLDARNSTTANSAAGYVSAIVEAFNGAEQKKHGGAPPALSLENRAWYNANLETRWNIMPALIASLSLLQTILLTALSVAREREQGTFDQMLVTPFSPLEIMIGKAIPPMLIGLLQSTLVLIVTLFWFQIPLAGHLFHLYLGLTAFLLAGVGIGLSVSAVSLNMQQAMLYTFVLLMPMMLLSGLATPVATMPRVLQIATLVNPLRFGIDIVRRIYLEGIGLGALVPDLVPLALIALVTLPTAAWFFRHRLA